MNCTLKTGMAFMLFSITGQSQTILTTSITASGPTTVCAPATVSLSVATNSNGWLNKGFYPGVNHAALIGFSINDKGYVGGGWGTVTLGTDFWEYEPIAGTWTQKASMPARHDAVGFSIGNKGYLCLGIINSAGTIITNQLVEYDPVNNTWTQKAPFPGNPRVKSMGFSINNKGYVGTGSDLWGVYYDDFWEYDPATDIWTQKANVPGGLREAAVGFNIGNKGYVGLGWNFTHWSSTRDFWEYDPLTNTWAQKANFGGAARGYSAGFSIGCKGYVGIGFDSPIYTDFWQYDPITNSWAQKQNFPFVPQLGSAVSYSLYDKGYVFATHFNVSDLQLYEYTPALSNVWNTGAVTPSIVATTGGNYSVSINSDACYTSTASISVVINNPGTPVTGFTYPSPLCILGADPLPIPDQGFAFGGVFSGTGVSLDSGTGKIHLQNTGLGTHTVMYSVPASTCSSVGSGTTSITIYQNPALSVSTNTSIVLGESTVLTAVSSANTYTWFPAVELSCADCPTPVASPFETSTYCVRTTDGACTNTACVTVNIELPCSENSGFSVPNAFSPNGDGINDLFCAQGSDRYITYFSLSIYDRWGEKIYETSDFSSCWDGTYKGKLLNPDVFVYYIKALCGEKKEIVKKGNLTLIK